MKIKIAIFLFLLGFRLSGQDQLYINKPIASIGNQILIPLHLIQDDEQGFKELESLADSVIYTDEFGGKRKFIDYNVGIKHLNYLSDQNIVLFDKFNKQISVAEFSHFENYESGGNGSFVAAYNVIDKSLNNDDISYCINEKAILLIDKKIRIEKMNPFFTPNSKSFRSKNNLLYEDYIGYKSSYDSARFIMLSSETTKLNNENYNFECIVYDGANNQERVVLNINEGYVLEKIYVTSFIYNEKPILLFDTVVPDTDNYFFIVAIWNNDKYEVCSSNVIEYK